MQLHQEERRERAKKSTQTKAALWLQKILVRNIKFSEFYTAVVCGIMRCVPKRLVFAL